VNAGELAPRDIVAPRAIDFVSVVQTSQARAAARAAVEPQYDFTSENAIAIAEEQQLSFERRVQRIDTTFAADLGTDERAALLETAVPGLSQTAGETLVGLDAARWAAVRTEAARVLDATLRTELRDTQVAEARTGLSGRMAGGLDESERMLAAELISPLLIPNSSFSPGNTALARDRAAEGVEDVRVQILQGEVIVREGTRIDDAQIEQIDALGLSEVAPDVASFVGWLLLAVLVSVMLMSWIWRFRPTLWHRDNVLILIGLLIVGATLALQVTAGRPTLPYFLPTAAIAMLLAVLLDASIATIVMAFVALVGGAVNGASLEFATYIFLGGMAGIVGVRKGDRLQVFLQAAVAVFIVSGLVVTVFSLLGARDLRGILELGFASAASAAGSGIAAVGSFAVLGSVFGILTVFQLLELANPSQPLLRRLLVETPGTYHHSLMVGNLAERGAEAIGADPLVTRVAAYYHDIGKLANPLAFIENQAGGENIHDQLDPEVSAGILKQHVVDGIDLAYKSRLPKALIAYIPQHHGTAIMSYFHARAKEAAGPGASVDERQFRHSGPKPQTREAALIMLADGVEASVRSLAARDEPAIRAMVTRIIEERTSDGQFDECDLTMRDLETIRRACVKILLGIYHGRIAYPSNAVQGATTTQPAAPAIRTA
jgi:cyclic-di-AMP phosphodiesterase PgpH